MGNFINHQKSFSKLEAAEKFFSVVDPATYHQIMLALTFRKEYCREKMAENKSCSDLYFYWLNELKDVENAYNQLP